MTLKNVILIADNSLKMALYGRSNGMQYRYNFSTNSWDPDTVIDSNKLITIDKFRKSDIYKKYKHKNLISWSILDARRCKKLADEYKPEDFPRDIIVSISIELISQGSTTNPQGCRAQADGVRLYGQYKSY